MASSLLSLLLFAAVLQPLLATHDVYEALTRETSESTSEISTEAPGFPKSYEVEYIMYLPYSNIFSSSPVKYPVHMWLDHEDDDDVKIRIDNNNGLNKKITLENVTYTVFPRVNETRCTKSLTDDHHVHHYLTSKSRGLPHDMKNWTHMGKGVYEGTPCDVYRLTEEFYERVAYYTLYISLDGTPLYLSAIGQNYWSGAHFDEYLVYFTNYKAGVPDPSVFDEPEVCENRLENHPTDLLGVSPLVLQMDYLVPRVVEGHPDYDEFISNHGRFHSSPLEYEYRLQIFLKNKEHIDAHNARNEETYTLELNKYADWTDEEFLALKTGHLEEDEEVEKVLKAHADFYTDVSDLPINQDIPDNFTWYNTGADGVVKDQAICGSCWAFAATGAMEGAWFVATNESISLSEQQLADCAWDYFNYACEGGFISLAILYAIQNNGSASEFAYPYKGYDDYCKPNVKSLAKFDRVGIAGRHNQALMKAALVTFGPMGVSMDAGHLDFRFYKEGVFVQPECSNNHTNHAVTLIGWGHEDGRDYWLLRNSWSTFWGNKGYVKMDMKYDCGVSFRPVFTIADPSAAAERREELRLLKT